MLIKGKHKNIFDWVTPFLLAVISTSVVVASGDRFNFYGTGGLVSAFTAFVQNLPGFFVAALAAIATFNRSDLDQLLPEPTPTIPTQAQGTWVQVELTRRRFLSVLFAFLTAQSIAVTVLGIWYQNLAPWIVSVVPVRVSHLVAYAGTFIYLIAFWQLVTVTCLGLYYLGDRIHQPEGS